MALTTVLSALDTVLGPKKQRPAKKVNLEVHPELDAVWKWGRAAEVLGHEQLETVAAERDEWWWSQVWLSPADALSAQKELREVPGFPQTLVPFATDEAGNYTCHDVKTGKLVDWDHETRKTRKLPRSLLSIFSEAYALLSREARAAPPPPLAPGGEGPPTALRPLKSPVLRKLSANHRLHGFTGAAISGDGTLVAGAVYGTHAGCFGHLGSNVEVIPQEPGFSAQKKSMGFVSMHSHGFVFEGDQLAWRIGEQLTLWSWRSGALSLESGGQWKKGDFMDKVPLRLRGGWLGAAAIAKDQVVIPLWQVDSFPGVKALAGATAALKPKSVLAVGPWTGAELLFDLDHAGNVFTLESPEYEVISLSRWDAKSGKRLGQQRVKDVNAVDLAVSPDGARVLVLTREGEVLVFDASLALGQRLKTFGKGKWVSSGVRFAPSGAFFVTSARQLSDAAGELAVWGAPSLQLLARLAVKEAAQGFRVSSVCQAAVVTTSPLAAFELRRS